MPLQVPGNPHDGTATAHIKETRREAVARRLPILLQRDGASVRQLEEAERHEDGYPAVHKVDRGGGDAHACREALRPPSPQAEPKGDTRIERCPQGSPGENVRAQKHSSSHRLCESRLHIEEATLPIAAVVELHAQREGVAIQIFTHARRKPRAERSIVFSAIVLQQEAPRSEPPR